MRLLDNFFSGFVQFGCLLGELIHVMEVSIIVLRLFVFSLINILCIDLLKRGIKVFITNLVKTIFIMIYHSNFVIRCTRERAIYLKNSNNTGLDITYIMILAILELKMVI